MPQKSLVGARLYDLRHRLNANPLELAKAMGMGVGGYLELENTDRLFTKLTLYKLTLLSKALAMEPLQLFSEHAAIANPSPRAFIPLVHAVRSAMQQRGGTQESFEAEIGWKLGDFVARPEAAWAWTVDGLRKVCEAVGLDWLATLPKRRHLDEVS